MYVILDPVACACQYPDGQLLLCPFAHNSFIGPPRSAILKVLVTLTKNPPSDPRQDSLTPYGKVRAAPVLGTYSMLFVRVSARSSFAANRLLWGSPTLLGQAPCPVGRLARRHRGMEFRLPCHPGQGALEQLSIAGDARKKRKREKESWVSPGKARQHRPDIGPSCLPEAGRAV